MRLATSGGRDGALGGPAIGHQLLKAVQLDPVEFAVAAKAAAHAHTPTPMLLDPLVRVFQTIEHNGLDGNQDPIVMSQPRTESWRS